MDLLNLPVRLRWLASLHLLALVGGAVLVAIAASQIPGLPVLPLLLILSILATLNLLLLAYLRRNDLAALPQRTHQLIIHGQCLLDLIGLTALLHFGGGAENPFYPFYVFPVILAAALLPRIQAFFYAGLATILYAGLLLVERAGMLAHHHLTGFADPNLYQQGLVISAQVVAVAVLCFIAAEATAVLVGALRNRAGELAESRERAEVRAARMRELNDQLRAANDECRHARVHLDMAYEELQKAFDRLQIRSTRMSELNEQLRLANAECAGRRQELADVNARLQEAYHRLEVRSDHMRELNEQLRVANAECAARRDELAQLNQELAQANEKLRQLEDIRAQFTLLVTHELRAPVAAIQSYLKLILEGYVPEAKVHETLVKAERRAMEQLALIADLLELGRIGSADARGQVQPVHVEAALREQVDLLSAGARERGIDIDLDVEDALPPVRANPDQIKSLWNNLISNAIKYNRDGGRVDVSLRREGRRLVASVSDTGIGIPPEAMSRLFSEFFRADNAKQSGRTGTGLGLSIVREIVERTGGKITVKSELGAGTTFRFWLPLLTDVAETHAPAPASQDRSTS